MGLFDKLRTWATRLRGRASLPLATMATNKSFGTLITMGSRKGSEVWLVHGYMVPEAAHSAQKLWGNVDVKRSPTSPTLGLFLQQSVALKVKGNLEKDIRSKIGPANTNYPRVD